jgi:hypothetical protein
VERSAFRSIAVEVTTVLVSQDLPQLHSDLFRDLCTDFSRDLFADLDVGDDLDSGDATLEGSLRHFTTALEVAVPTYLGLQLTIVEHDHAVTVTRIATDRAAHTSLRLPLTALHPGSDPESRITLYSATAGALVDLAADLSYVLRDDAERIILDADLPPSTLVSGTTGLYELSTINRALGVLIGRGHHPDHARETLRRDASRLRLETHAYAAQLLGR